MRLAFTEAGGANNLELLLSSALENSPRQGKSKRLGHLRGKADERDVVPARDVDSVRQPGLAARAWIPHIKVAKGHSPGQLHSCCSGEKT